jgi:DNA-binding XRE family transcriptional regulator
MYIEKNPKTGKNECFITRSEAAKYYGVARQTVDNWQIEFGIRRGNTTHVELSVLIAYRETVHIQKQTDLNLSDERAKLTEQQTIKTKIEIEQKRVETEYWKDKKQSESKKSKFEMEKVKLDVERRKLELRVRSGELLEATEVEARWIEIVQAWKSKIMQVTRIVHRIIAQKEIRAAEKILQDALKDACQELSEESA